MAEAQRRPRGKRRSSRGVAAVAVALAARDVQAQPQQVRLLPHLRQRHLQLQHLPMKVMHVPVRKDCSSCIILQIRAVGSDVSAISSSST